MFDARLRTVKRAAMAGAALTALLTAAGSGAAQAADNAQVSTVEAITVTAQRRSENVQRVPIAIRPLPPR